MSHYHGTNWIDSEVTGKLVTVSKIVITDDMEYEKVFNIIKYKHIFQFFLIPIRYNCNFLSLKVIHINRTEINFKINILYNKTVCHS